MIALYPPPALAEQLALPGGEAAAELHVTLAYLGRRSALPVAPAQLVAGLREAAGKGAPLRGQLGGVIRFPASDSSEGRDPFCAGVDLPGLVELRELLRQALEAQGVKLSADHGFTPHVTLVYLAPDAPAPLAQIPAHPVVFTEALLVAGEERWPLPLGPAPAAALQRYFRGAHVRFEHEAGPRVGVWDQVCNYGTHTKPSIAGKPLVTSFNAATCQQMLEDFAARKNDLFLDKQHEVTEEGLTGDDDLQAWGDQHAMAWYNALAHVSENRVVGYAAHAGAPPAAPSLEDLRRPDGALPASGLYALRSQVTPRGADPKEGIPAFRYVSPYFYQRDEEHYRLLNITATNDPFLDGVALAMSASKYAGADTPKEKKPMEELYTRAGCMEGDTPDQKLEKMARYAQQLEEEKAAEMARAKMEADKAFAGKETPEEEKKEAAAMARRLKALEEKNTMLEATVKEQGSTLAAEREARAKQEKAERDAKAAAFARDAIAMGRVKADHKGDPGKTQEWLAAKFVKDPAEAEDVLSPEGTFGISEPAVLQRMTRGGAGIGAPDPRGTQGTDAVDNWGRLVSAEQKNARAAGKELRFDEAEKLVKKTNPAAYQAYTRQKMGA